MAEARPLLVAVVPAAVALDVVAKPSIAVATAARLRIVTSTDCTAGNSQRSAPAQRRWGPDHTHRPRSDCFLLRDTNHHGYDTKYLDSVSPLTTDD